MYQSLCLLYSSFLFVRSRGGFEKMDSRLPLKKPIAFICRYYGLIHSSTVGIVAWVRYNT